MTDNPSAAAKAEAEAWTWHELSSVRGEELPRDRFGVAAYLAGYRRGAAAERDRTCEWTTEDERLPDDQSGPYSTACGEEFYVTHGLEPYDFCPYCGGKIVVKPE